MGRSRVTLRHKKKNLLAALEQTLGVVTSACKKAGVDRRDYYEWMKGDPEFKEAADKIGDIAFDFVESSLYKQIQENNVAATIFWLKTKGRSKGYSERLELTGPDGEAFSPITINLPMMPTRNLGESSPTPLILPTGKEIRGLSEGSPAMFPQFLPEKETIPDPCEGTPGKTQRDLGDPPDNKL
jgi:hypothetical protein